jgi:hypothetical protein
MRYLKVNLKKIANNQIFLNTSFYIGNNNNKYHEKSINFFISIPSDT